MGAKRRITRFTNKGMTIDEAFENFIEVKKSLNRSGATISNFRMSYKIWNDFLESTALPLYINQVDESYVHKFMNYCLGEDMKSTSLNHYLRDLRSFLYWAMERNLIEKSFKIKMVTEQEVIKETYSEEELKLLLAKPTKNDSFASMATIVGAPVALVALIFSAVQFWLNRKHEKCKDTLEAYNRLQAEVFDELYTKYSKAKIAEVVANYRKNDYKADYHQLGLYLARIEHFCVGVEQDIYDWKTLYELAHGFFDLTIRSRLSPLVDRKESFTQDEMYANLKSVWRKMDAETERKKKE